MRKKTWLSWSSGKDSAWALHVLRQSGEFEVTGLFTTINAAFDRVAMHAVRVELLRLQAQAVGLPLYLIEIPYPCSDEQYAAAMANFVARARNEGVRCMAFGDLYLQDIRRYREERLHGTGIDPVFPLPELLADMPASVDPCGENGEFHSFVFDGPMFAQPLDIERGEVVTRDGFVFADCLPRRPGESVPTL